MVSGKTRSLLGLGVAGLELWLDARESGIQIAVPDCHAPFLLPGTPAKGLVLGVREADLRSTEGWQCLYYDAETWKLWLDDAGQRVFVTAKHAPPLRQVTVDSTFSQGEVIGAFGSSQGKGAIAYPLQDIDMVIMANWLAESGDLIIHASGIDDGGHGYVFMGPSGSGKSTIATELTCRSGVPVLGEDQVIIRHQEGQFVMYGTPWHTNIARCAPGGIPLKKIFFLNREAGHRAERCEAGAAVGRLLQDAFIPYYHHAGVRRILDTLSCLADEIPFFSLGFQIGSDVLSLVREA